MADITSRLNAPEPIMRLVAEVFFISTTIHQFHHILTPVTIFLKPVTKWVSLEIVEQNSNDREQDLGSSPVLSLSIQIYKKSI